MVAALSILFALVFLVAALLYFLAAYGVWKRRGWGWWLTVVVNALALIGSLASLAMGGAPSLVTLILAVALLYAVTRPSVKAHCGRP